jgi:outer membrane protein OmpA-like peptidoglycan-associated protein
MRTFGLKVRPSPTSGTMPSDRVRAYQRTPAVRHILRAPQLQPKLKIGAVDDPAEREADRVADQVMRMPAPAASDNLHRGEVGSLRRKCACGGSMECADCGTTGEAQLQRRAAGGGKPGIAPQIVHEVLRAPSLPLDDDTRAFMEPRFGQDFGDVRVHADRKAGESARKVNALAYTVGQDVVFGAGQFAPHSGRGRGVLAHELAHVVQQRGSIARGTTLSAMPPGQAQLQRLGDLDKIPAGLPCATESTTPSPITDSILFENRISALNATNHAQIENVVLNWRAAGANQTVRIDGFASQRGTDELNWRLSCERAMAVANDLMHPSSGTPGIPASFISIFMAGETAEFGPESENRRATIVLGPSPIRPVPPSTTAACQTPTNSDQSGTAFNPTTDSQATVIASHLIDSFSANSCADDSFAAAGASGLAGPHLGPQDAFRHCFWACCMTQSIGAAEAEQFGTGHENSGPSAIPFDNQMDLHDNSIGRGLGTPGADCSEVCLAAVTSGLLRTVRGPDTVPSAVPPVPTACMGASDQPWP